MFTSNENRRAPTSARLQNGKIGGDPSWFAMGGGNAPGLSTQPRTTAGMASFAQTIGGQQHRPLDLSEFPSLGGGAQPQQQINSSSPGGSYPWTSTSNVRPRSPERSYARGFGRGAQQPEEAPSSNFAPGTEGYHFGRAATGQLSGLAQQQTGSSMQHSRLGMTSPEGEQPDRASASVIGDDRYADSSSRLGGDGAVHGRGGRTVANPYPSDLPTGPVGYQGRTAAAHDQASNTDTTSSPPPRDGMKRLADMTPEEQYGIPGLLARTNPKSLDFNQFSLGVDVTQLGLNLDSNEPLINTFGSPFDDRPVIPEFTVPPAYNVTNVPPLLNQMNSFTDETLIMIFYTNPRDILQEHAASALFKRDWRWHTELRQWMQKDPQAAQQPTRLTDKEERGYYIFFDVSNWRRERREFVLNYDYMYPKFGMPSSVARHAGPHQPLNASHFGANF